MVRRLIARIRAEVGDSSGMAIELDRIGEIRPAEVGAGEASD